LVSNKYQYIIEKLKKKEKPSEITYESMNEILQELDIYHAELLAQNDELLEKEQKLSNSNEEYQLLFYDAPVAYLIIDKSFLIIQYNKKANECFRISLNPLVKKAFFSLFSISFLKDFLKWIANEEYIASSFELDMKYSKNELRRFKLFANKYPLNDNYLLLSLIDIHEEYLLKKDLEKEVIKKTEQNLKQYQILQHQTKLAAMGEMIANIAHQWRQPLNILSAYNIDIMIKYKNKKLNDTIMENFSSKSENLIKNMNNTIESFINFFKPDKKQVNFYIFEVLNESFNFIKESFYSNNISLEINCNKDLQYKGYKNELEQVVLIILNNSKDAFLSQEKDGLISINVLKNRNESISIEFIDDAGGIQEDIIDRIFEPYFTTKHKNQGTGIGLYMTKVIIEESMKGTIKIKNTNKGVKTTITLPI